MHNNEQFTSHKLHNPLPANLITAEQMSILSQRRAIELESAYQEKVKASLLPLQKEIIPQEPFPFSALGTNLESAAKRIHEIVKAPDSICGQSVLGAAALITQPHADVHIDGRVHPLSLFLLTVAESGDRKSAVDSIVLKPVRDFEKMLASVYLQERGNYKNKLDIWKRQRDQILKDKNQTLASQHLEALGLEPLAPLAPHILLEEPTYEGLVKLYLIGQPSVGLSSDEGGRMLGGYSMSKDNILKTICGLSSLWDGKPITRIRSGDENFILYGRRFSMHLMVQEIIHSTMQHNHLLTGQGLLARCLIISPASNAGARPYCEVDISEEPIIKEFWKLCSFLLDHPFPLKPNTQNDLNPRALSLDPQAKKLWVSFHDKIDSALRCDGLWYSVRRTANKAAEQALRIAGILMLMENFDASTIRLDVLERAICLTEYYLNEALRISEMPILDPDLVLAQKTYNWMKKKRLEIGRDIFSTQYIYQNAGPREMRKKEVALKILKILEDHGMVQSCGVQQWRCIVIEEAC